jgi:hypothetical protein
VRPRERDYLDVTVLGRGPCDVLPLLLLTDSIRRRYHLVRTVPYILETCYKINEREQSREGGCIFVLPENARAVVGRESVSLAVGSIFRKDDKSDQLLAKGTHKSE